MRTDGETDFIFIMNFNKDKKELSLDQNKYYDVLSNEKVNNEITLEGYGIKILKRSTK